MHKAVHLNHDELYQAMQNGDLDPASFDHDAHIRLAWHYLTHWPYNRAVEQFERDFERFIVEAGAASKYHKTITAALLQLIASHLKQEPCRTDWAYFKRDAEPLFTDAYALLLRFYSKSLLDSDAARHQFASPDINTLPEPHTDMTDIPWRRT